MIELKTARKYDGVFTVKDFNKMLSKLETASNRNFNREVDAQKVGLLIKNTGKTHL